MKNLRIAGREAKDRAPENSFGDIIYRRRRALNLTQEALADKVGVKPTYIGYLERGKRRPGPNVVQALAEALEMDKAYLYLAANPAVRRFLQVDADNRVTSPLWSPALIELRQDNKALREMHGITDTDIERLAGFESLFSVSFRDKADAVAFLGLVRCTFKE